MGYSLQNVTDQLKPALVYAKMSVMVTIVIYDEGSTKYRRRQFFCTHNFIWIIFAGKEKSEKFMMEIFDGLCVRYFCDSLRVRQCCCALLQTIVRV